MTGLRDQLSKQRDAQPRPSGALAATFIEVEAEEMERLVTDIPKTMKKGLKAKSVEVEMTMREMVMIALQKTWDL